MCKKIAIVNQKGGVGKTTTAATLSVGLVQRGFKVLVVDADSQGSLTISFGIEEPDELDNTLAELFNADIDGNEYETNKVIMRTKMGVDLLPSNINLASVEISLSTAMQREYCLKRIIQQVEENYDYIIIDSPPALNLVSINILSAVNEVIIPVRADYLSGKGMQALLKTINKIRNRLNSELQIGGILLTMTRKTNLSLEVEEMFKSTYASLNVFNSMIPLSVTAEEATTVGQTVLTYSLRSNVAKSYIGFINEYLEKEQNNGKKL